MAKNSRDFNTDSIRVGNISLAIYENKHGRLCFRDIDFPQGVCLKDLMGALTIIIQKQIQINKEDIITLFSLVEGITSVQTELIDITGFLQQQITSNSNDISSNSSDIIDIYKVLGSIPGLSGGDFVDKALEFWNKFQDQITDINTYLTGISGDWALLSEPNVFLTDNFFNTDVSVANDLFVSNMISANDITISGSATILQKQEFRDELDIYSKPEVDSLMVNKIDKVLDATLNNIAVFDISGGLLDGGISLNDVVSATGNLQTQIDEVNDNIVFSKETGISAISTECVPISSTDGALWMITVIDENNISNRYGSMVFTMHDGISGVDFTEFSVLETGAMPPIVVTDVDIVNGMMCISVSSGSVHRIKLARVRTSKNGDIL